MKASIYKTPLFYSFCFLYLGCFVFNIMFSDIFFRSIESQVITEKKEIKIVINAHKPNNNIYFDPPIEIISKDGEIIWVNEDSSFHTVVSGIYGSGAQYNFSSPLLITGDKFSYIFNNTGTFNYFCTLHPFMTGTIKVT